MRVFAYCDRSFAQGMRRVAGVKPVTCPPMTAETFEPHWLEDRELILIDLHGEPGEAAWYAIDDAGSVPRCIDALRAEQIRQADLGNAIVFAASCYLADEDSPMLDALLDAGARYVIAAPGENYAGRRRLMGASLLGYIFRLALERGRHPLKALAVAKRWLRWWPGRDAVEADTLEFRAYYRPGGTYATDADEKNGGRT